MSLVTVLISCLVLLVGTSHTNQAHARATSAQLTTPAPLPLVTTMTTTSATASSLWSVSPTSSGESASALTIDDPTNSATTSDENTDDMPADDICVRCYDKVKAAQDMVETYEGLLRKQRKLISRKKAAAEAAAAAAAASSSLSSSSNSNTNRHLARSVGSQNQQQQQQHQVNGQNSTVRSRTLMNQQDIGSQGEQIVVSTLRVARSPMAPVPLPAQATGLGQSSPSGYRPLSKDKYAAILNKKDVELERLKREQERQKDFTCKALLELRECLEVLARECIGNLHFHTYELFADQWHGKLRCPYPNNPKIRPMPGLRIMDLDTTKTPVPRPISNPEEVRKRMHMVLDGSGGLIRARPLGAGGSVISGHRLGVILEPTKQQSFNQQQQQQQQQHQEQQSSAGFYQSSMRDFSGYHFGQDVQQLNDNSLNMVNVGKILLVPCCFAIMVALVALASLHYNRPDEDDEEDKSHTGVKY